MTEPTEHTYRVQIQDQGLTDDIRDFLRAGAPGTSATSPATLTDAPTAGRRWFVAQGLSRRDAQTLRRQLEVLGLHAEVEPDAPNKTTSPSTNDADPWGAVLGITTTAFSDPSPASSPPVAATPAAVPLSSPASPLASSLPPSLEPFDWLSEVQPAPPAPLGPSQPPQPPAPVLTPAPALPFTPAPVATSPKPPFVQQKKPIAVPTIRTSAPATADRADDAPTPWVFGVASLLVPGWGLTLLGHPAEGFRVLISAPLVVPWSRSVFNAYRRAQNTDHQPEVQWGPVLAHLGAWIGVLAVIWLLLPAEPPPNTPVIDVQLNPVDADETQDPPDPDEQTPDPDEQTPDPTSKPLPATNAPNTKSPDLTQAERAEQLKRANTLLADAELACDANDTPRCVALLEQVIQLDPTRRRAYELLARARTLTAPPEPPPEPLPPDLYCPTRS